MAQKNAIIDIRFIRRFYGLFFFFFCNHAVIFVAMLIIPLFWVFNSQIKAIYQQNMVKLY
jgi:hypothetical protein